MSGESTLNPADLQMFNRLGIGPDLLADAGIRRVTDNEAFNQYGMSLDGDKAGIVFPYFDPVRGNRVTARLRRDNPEIDSDGKPENKYICVCGDNRHIYFPPGVYASLSEPTVPVVFVESEKAALAITALAVRSVRRLLAIATGGCWGWRGKVGIKTTATGGREEERGPLSDLSLFTWEQERPAFVVFDSNTATNPRVRSARWAFAQALVGLGAKVLFVDIPGEGGVNGPDDLIGTAGDDAMLKLLDTARPFAEQAEKDAEEAVSQLSKTSPLEARDAALDLIAAVSDVSHQRVLASRAAVALKEGKDAVHRDVGLRVRASREASKQALSLVRQERLLRMKIEPASLIAELETFLRKRLALPDGATLILALFTVNTYLFDLFDTTPYIQIDSAVGGCGKTTLLLHLEATCCRAYLGCDPTEATLYRRIDRDRPTWLLDEASVVRGHEERARMIRAILDAGYRRGATVSRCEGENNDLRDFGVYCPKAFALVGSLRGTLLDRCIVLHLQKTPGLPKTKLKRLRHEAPLLRERLEAYATQYREELQRLDESEPDEGYWPQFDGREEELWGPLLFHAKLAGPETEQRALAVALGFSRQKGQLASDEDQTVALAIEVLEVLAKMNVETFSPSQLQEALATMESWGEKLAKCKSDKARVCTIGSFLKNFRLRSRERDSHGTCYSLAEAVDVIRRHLPRTDTPHATEAQKTRDSDVASPENGHATGATGPVPVTTRGTTVASAAEEPATEESRMNTGGVACGNSNAGGGQGILKF